MSVTGEPGRFAPRGLWQGLGNAERPPPALRWVAAFLACGGRLSSNPACRPYHRLVSTNLAGCDPPSGRGPWFGLAPYTGDRASKLAPLRDCRAFRRRGLPTGLPCGASQLYHPAWDGCPPSAPLAVAFGSAGAVTPMFPMAFGDSRPVGLSPPAVWFSTTPPPTPRNVAPVRRYSKQLMTPRNRLHKALKKASDYRRKWYPEVTKRGTAAVRAYVASLVKANQSGCGPIARIVITSRSGPYQNQIRHALGVRFST